jgi:protein-S-isoprenylcysteine O-methyltransferase Ste14
MARELGNEQAKSRISDLFWYVVIGLGVVVLIIVGTFVFVKFVPERYWPTKRWWAFTFFTILLFAFLIKAYWEAHKPRTFWWLLMLLFTAHVIVTAPLVPYIRHAYIYPIVMPFEFMMMAAVIKRLVNVMPLYTKPL